MKKKIHNVSGLVIKTDYDTKISELEKKLTNQTDDKYNTTSEFNTLAATVNNQKQILILDCQVLIEKLFQINQNICWLKMSWKS